MAEERNLALPRAQAPDDEDASKEQLQRRMEEARESITQTVSEIKETVATQYQNVRDALDWREHYRRRPLAFGLSALGVGFLAGYGFGHLVVGDSRSSKYPAYDEDYEEGNGRTLHSYAALAPAVTMSARESAPSAQADSAGRGAHSQSGGILDVGPDSRPSSYNIGGASNSSATATTAEEPDKPGLISRFKETKAYDRLQEEVSTIGDRILDELSRTAQTVVLPALFNKIKDMIGVDLSRQQAGGRVGATGAQQTGGARTAQQTSATSGTHAGGGQSSSMSADDDMTREQRPHTMGGASQSARAGGSATGGSATGGGTSYGTSENKGYGSSS